MFAARRGDVDELTGVHDFPPRWDDRRDDCTAEPSFQILFEMHLWDLKMDVISLAAIRLRGRYPILLQRVHQEGL